jgi:hypothetical protein
MADEKADETVSCVYDAMQQIQLKGNFSKNLPDGDLKAVYLSALHLSAATLDCLTIAILSISSRKRGIPLT